jgi:hypothetical protein
MTKTHYQLIQQTNPQISVVLMDTDSKEKVFAAYESAIATEFFGSLKIIKATTFSEKIAESYDERQMLLGI